VRQDDLLVIHERIGEWGRQLRPRLAHREARLRETRFSGELTAALRGRATALLLLDARRHLRDGLDDLFAAREECPGLLSLVIVDRSCIELAHVVREWGATHVASAATLRPPAVSALFDRWLDIAARRRRCSGISRFGETESPPDDGPAPPTMMIAP
jgi:hypothetical protein